MDCDVFVAVRYGIGLTPRIAVVAAAAKTGATILIQVFSEPWTARESGGFHDRPESAVEASPAAPATWSAGLLMTHNGQGGYHRPFVAAQKSGLSACGTAVSLLA